MVLKVLVGLAAAALLAVPVGLYIHSENENARIVEELKAKQKEKERFQKIENGLRRDIERLRNGG